MRNRSVWTVVLIGAGCASAQWLNQATPGTPRTKDGTPNLSAPAPRTVHGRPDLSGVWQVEPAPFEDLARVLPGGLNGLGEAPPSKYFLNVLWDYKPEEAPLHAAAAAAFQKRAAKMGLDFPLTRCLPATPPLSDVLPEPYKIVQTPGVVVMLHETDTNFRQIFTDGRKPPADPLPSWMGYSVGKWDGDTLVVETAGFNGKGWLDALGHTASESLRLTERFTRRDYGHMDVQFTLDDPETFTKPVTIKVTQVLLPDTDLLESFCAENERDVAHMAVSE